MNIIVIPIPFSFLRVLKSSFTSIGVRTDVGSSSINILAFLNNAFSISVLCCKPTGKSSITASNGTFSPVLFMSSFAFSSTSSIVVFFIVDNDKYRFSSTVNVGTKVKCWYTIPILCFMASHGPLKLTLFPKILISPLVGFISPYSILISVVFPAPFSPRRPCISPCITVKSTPLRAIVPSGYILTIFFISIAGVSLFTKPTPTLNM